jgi:hypothetical protein
VLDAFLQQLADDRYQVDTLAVGPKSIVHALGLRLDSRDRHRLLIPLLDAISQSYHSYDGDELLGLVRALQVLGPNPEQAQAALAFILKAMRQTPASYEHDTPAMAQAVQTLHPGPEQGKLALEFVAAAMEKTTDVFMLRNLARIFQALNPTPKLTQAALDLILRSIRETDDCHSMDTLVEAVQALGPSPEQAQFALKPVLDWLHPIIDVDYYQTEKIKTLAKIIRVLGPELSAEQAQAALAPVLAAIGRATTPDHIAALAQAVQALGPSREQAQAALAPVLAAIGRATAPDQIPPLAHAVQALGPSPEQAQAALAPVLAAIGQAADGPDTEYLAEAFGILGRSLNPEAARAALAPILEACRRNTDPDPLLPLARALQVLGSKVTGEDAEHAADVASTMLATSDYPRIAEASARVIAVILPAMPVQPFVASVVELLKWPTTAGPATDALLEVLHERVPGAPGKEAGLDATVAWVAATYPDIDLDSPRPTRSPAAPAALGES